MTDTINDLKHQSAQWVARGIISENQRVQILVAAGAPAPGEVFSQGPTSPGASRQQKLTATIATLGAILVGMGIILFFASNWQAIAPWQKMSLLLTALVATHGLGFWLYNKENGFPGMGLSLIFLGSILYGSNIYLVAQAYNISAHWPNGVLWWGMGVLPLALLMGSRAIAALTILTLCLWMNSNLYLSANNYSVDSLYLLMSANGFWGMGLLALGLWLEERASVKKCAIAFEGVGLFLMLAALFAWTFGHMENVKRVVVLVQMTEGKTMFMYYAVGASGAAGFFLAWANARFKPLAGRLLSLWVVFCGAWLWSATALLPAQHFTTAILGNLIMFTALIVLLYIGYLNQKPFCVNLALLAFAGLIIARYFDFAWKYMNRSVGFIMAGLLLLAIGFGLERGRRALLRPGGPL